MSEALFICCPFSRNEAFLRASFGNDSLFLTFPGAVVQWENSEAKAQFLDVVARENIQQLYIVNDTECAFIDAIILKRDLAGLHAEHVIQTVYKDHYLTDFKNRPIANQKLKLAKLNVRHQINQLERTLCHEKNSSINQPEIRGVITSIENNQFIEINTETHGL